MTTLETTRENYTHGEDSETPRAWVGCLGCYNSGSLVGKWLDATECDDLEAAGLTDSAGHCKRCNADEFWVFDHENFLGVISGECSPMEAYEAGETLASVRDDEQEILAAWLALGFDLDIEAMREAYLGEFSTEAELAEYFIDELGSLEIPDSIRSYFDFEAYGRDLSHDFSNFSGYYFWSR